MQKNGIDGLIRNKMTAPDVKVRSKECHYYYNVDIGIEERTLMNDQYDENTGKPGWHYKIINQLLNQKTREKSPVLAYCWENENGTNLEPIGYLIPFTYDFYEWYENNKHLFPTNLAFTKTEMGTSWWTKNRYVPITSFPPGFIIKFNPKVSMAFYTNQSKVESFDSDKIGGEM
ncbi:unnamed protein product [marine sediment metagenome]|uniref:Uncharacterized protein n=1 Tax=marine sediment metagenome TaxID=412755 RepID=X0ZW61_9ZZZZ